MSKDKSDREESVQIFFEKSNAYRSVHADGFLVSPSPKLNIVMSFYSERLTIPRQTEAVPSSENTVSENVVKDKNGLFREVEVTVHLSHREVDELIGDLQRAKKFINSDMTESEGGGSDD